MVQKLRPFYWRGGFCPLVELHWEGSAPAACAAGLFTIIWVCLLTLNSFESIWPPPFRTGVYWNEEPAPEGQRDKEINFSEFILSLFHGVGQLLPGYFAGLLMSRPRLLAAMDSCCQKVPQSFSWSIPGVLSSFCVICCFSPPVYNFFLFNFLENIC